MDLESAIKSQFTDENAKIFMRQFLYDRRKQSGIVSTGFCYLAVHSYYQLANGKSKGLKIKKWIPENDKNDGHFWLTTSTGSIIDLTSDQYPNGFLHYNEGKDASPKNSKLIKQFIEKVKPLLDSNYNPVDFFS